MYKYQLWSDPSPISYITPTAVERYEPNAIDPPDSAAHSCLTWIVFINTLGMT